MPDIISRNIAPELGYRIIYLECTDTANEIGIKQHQLAGKALGIFSDGMMASLLLATQLKGDGVLSFEFDSDGPFDNFRSDATPLGYIRAMIPDETKEKLMIASDQENLVGKGNLYIGKKINNAKAPYSSILEMVSNKVAPNVAHYLKTSEQINGMVAFNTTIEDGKIKMANGVFVEEMPNVKPEQRAKMESTISEIDNIENLLNTESTKEEKLQSILKDVKIQNMKDFNVQFYCPCTGKRFFDSLLGLGKDELNDLSVNGKIDTVCDFCKAAYSFDLEEILSNKDKQ